MSASHPSGRHAGIAYLEQLRRAYGSLTDPVRSFALDSANREPYRAVTEDLARLGQVVDDTDVNCDVCFTLVLRSTSVLIVKLSMVGPYAVVLSFGQDGLAPQAELVGDGDDSYPADLATAVVSVLEQHGFVMVPRAHLESCVPLAVRGRARGVTLYSALFEPEAEVPW